MNMAASALAIVVAAVIASIEAAPAATPQQQIIPQAGGSLLIPASRFAQTEIQGVQYIILPANGAQQVSPGRFFLRSAFPGPAGSFPVAAAPQQSIVPVPVQPTVFGQREPQQQESTFRIAQPAPFPAIVPPPAPVQPVLVRQEVIEPGKKVAVFRKPLDSVSAVRVAGESKEINRPPQPYSFSYSINGPETGDVKSASETSDGNVVTGEYSVVEPDGTLRVVKYQADPVHGFSAQVERTAGAFPPIPDPVPAKNLVLRATA